MFYTYLWLREDGTPYYAGKGIGNRAFVNRHHIPHCPVDKTRILIQEFPSEVDALAAEQFLISYYGREDLGMGCLRNQTDGGEGSTGYKHTAESLRKMSSTHKDKTISPTQRAEHSKKMIGAGNPMFGKKRIISPEWREKLEKNLVLAHKKRWAK